MRTQEIDWWAYGMRTFFPAAWDRFAAFVNYGGDDNLLHLYYDRIHGSDTAAAARAAEEWNLYEESCARLIPDYDLSVDMSQHTLARARIQSHYFTHEIGDAVARDVLESECLSTIPGFIIQGRYDVICPIRTAHELHLRWPQARFTIVEASGHSPKDAHVRSRLVAVMDELARHTPH